MLVIYNKYCIERISDDYFKKMIETDWRYIDVDKLRSDDVFVIVEKAKKDLLQHGYSIDDANSLIDVLYQVAFENGYEDS